MEKMENVMVWGVTGSSVHSAIRITGHCKSNPKHYRLEEASFHPCFVGEVHCNTSLFFLFILQRIQPSLLAYIEEIDQ